jgi:hypothetical protein
LVQKGDLLPFEKKHKKRNPIETRRDLFAFVRDFGIDIEKEDFWKSDTDAIYLSETWSKSDAG